MFVCIDHVRERMITVGWWYHTQPRPTLVPSHLSLLYVGSTVKKCRSMVWYQTSNMLDMQSTPYYAIRPLLSTNPMQDM
jgi:hypothetical protein